MKVLFLDIDGPMIPTRAAHLTHGSWNRFDPVAVNLINTILENDVKLVISSSWRTLGGMYMYLALDLNGMDTKKLHKDWCTPKLSNELKTRESCILKWLSDHEDEGITHWVALDDMKLNLDNLVNVSLQNGLLMEHYLELKERLDIK